MKSEQKGKRANEGGGDCVMKDRSIFKVLGITALMAVIGFATMGCKRGGAFQARRASAGTIAIEMVRIPAGTFTMGSNDPLDSLAWTSATPPHEVTLSQGFYMGKYPVTQEQYEAVMGENPSVFTTAPDAGETAEKRPVEQVSWYDAIVFCNLLSMAEGLSPAYRIPGFRNTTDPDKWGNIPADSSRAWDAAEIVPGSKGYRLPTEAQWEYACRAGTATAYNTGAAISDDTGWYDSNSGGQTHEAGLKQPNAWGLYDMHGNVWEWCRDWHGDYQAGAQTNPAGAASGGGRVGRGGSWSNNSQFARSAYRGNSSPSYRDNYYGFRLVRPL